MTFLAQKVNAIIDRHLSPQAQSALLAKTAKKVLDNAIKSGRGTTDYRKWVDGHEGAAEETVRPGGVILYRFNRMGQIAQFALDFLIERSPQRSSAPIYGGPKGKWTHYRDGFYVAVDGKFILAKDFNPRRVPPTAEIVIGNVNAYSRKLDTGMMGTKKIDFNMVVPGFFDDAVREVKSKYGVIAEVKRVYTIDFPLQYTLQKEQHYGVGRRKGRPRGRKGSRVESPALIISPMR